MTITPTKKKGCAGPGKNFVLYACGLIAGLIALVAGLVFGVAAMAAGGFLIMAVSSIYVNYAVMDDLRRQRRSCPLKSESRAM